MIVIVMLACAQHAILDFTLTTFTTKGGVL